MKEAGGDWNESNEDNGVKAKGVYLTAATSG